MGPAKVWDITPLIMQILVAGKKKRIKGLAQRLTGMGGCCYQRLKLQELSHHSRAFLESVVALLNRD